MEPEALRYAALVKACASTGNLCEAHALANMVLDYMAGDAIQFTVTTND